jgi:hypothetical protein
VRNLTVTVSWASVRASETAATARTLASRSMSRSRKASMTAALRNLPATPQTMNVNIQLNLCLIVFRMRIYLPFWPDKGRND